MHGVGHEPEYDAGDHPGVYVIPPVAFLIAFFAGVFTGMAFGLRLWFLPWALCVLTGLALMTASIAFALWGIRGFRRNSAELRTYRAAPVLVSEGAHGISRNPMYLGMVGSLLGLGIACRALTLILAAVALYIYLDRYVIPREESYLARRFDAEFAAYRARVRRWF